MKAIGFLRPVTVGHGRHAVVLHHEIMRLPEKNVEALKAANPGAIVDMTPNYALGALRGDAPPFPDRHTRLRRYRCPHCTGQPTRLTMCPTCRGAGEVLSP